MWCVYDNGGRDWEGARGWGGVCAGLIESILLQHITHRHYDLGFAFENSS